MILHLYIPPFFGAGFGAPLGFRVSAEVELSANGFWKIGAGFSAPLGFSKCAVIAWPGGVFESLWRFSVGFLKTRPGTPCFRASFGAPLGV